MDMMKKKTDVVMVEDGDRSTVTSDPGMESDRTAGLGTNPRIGAYEQALNDLKAGKITEFEFKKITDDLANPPEENF